MSQKAALKAVANLAGDISPESAAAFALGHIEGQATSGAAENNVESTTRPLLIYWGGIASRGHYYQYMLGYFGLTDKVDFKCDAPWPGAEGWAEYPTSKMAQLPTLEDGDIKIGQSTAMVNYLARKFGLDDGLSLSDYATSQEMIQQAADVHSMLAGAKYSADVPAAMDALFAAGGKVDKLLAVFEQYVSASGFFGSVATPGDTVFAAALNLLTRLQADCLVKFPKIAAFNDTFQANEGVKAVNAANPNAYFTRK